MRYHSFIRSLRLLTAAVMSCNAVCSGMTVGAAAKQQETLQVPCQQTVQETPVTVIVKVTGTAALAHPDAGGKGADFLATDEAKLLTEQCRSTQQTVQERIRSIYPELQVGFSYTSLINGFSCQLPENLIEAVEALPDVVSVTKTEPVQIPQMDRAVQISGFPVCYDKTGCSGAGQVIAVIDTELDTSHPMFAPLADDVETAISRDDITKIVSSGILNVSVDDRAYISSKLPYAVDYLDEDPYGGVSDAYCYHGTAVSGIAAGNSYTAGDGAVLSGIAKDAQLMFFACGRQNGVYTDAAIAGFEDAVKLHADVITMSWGSNVGAYGEAFTEAVSAADSAGIIMCCAAGNSGNSTGVEPTPETPDTGTITNKAEIGSPILVAASAENAGESEAGVFKLNGQTIIYRPTADSLGKICYLSQVLAAGEYEYADCGTGLDEAIRAADPKDKIALIQRTPAQDIEKNAKNALDHGAIAVIVIDTEYTDGQQFVTDDSDLKLAFVDYADGQKMLKSENKTIVFDGESVVQDDLISVSSYTSWGVRNSLDLRPDIMGIGGRVRSAAYDEKDAVSSGTSMAAPYIAGCAAVIRQYLTENAAAQTGADYSAYVRKLLMNTAIPCKEEGLYVTPRRQGAGLVSLDRAVSAKVLMTGASGEAKVNLFDQLGSSFSFPVTFTNYSDEDVTFANAELRLTTDGTQISSKNGTEVLAGQQNLICTADISGPVTVAAGASETAEIHVELDAAQYEALTKQFRYGFFAEGYLLLSGAENSADISIPLLGFSGDWAALPIASQEQLQMTSLFGKNYIVDGVPLVEYQDIIKQISARVPDSVPKYQILDLRPYATEEECRLLDYGRNEVWISPDGDTIADLFCGIRMAASRSAFCDLELHDADGNLLFEEKEMPLDDRIPLRFNQASLRDGDYSLVLKAYIDYPGSAEHPQIFRSTLHVDRVAPTASRQFIEKEGRKIIVVTASDDRALQGAIVTGVGKGGLADTFDPQKAVTENCWYFGTVQHGGSYPLYSDDDREKLKQVPFSLRQRAGFSTPDEDRKYDFCDYVVFQEKADGTYTIEYDVTDLEDYTFTVLDKAYNYDTLGWVDEDSAEKLVQLGGTWLDPQKGVYEVGENKITFYDFFDGTLTEFDYRTSGDYLLLNTEQKSEVYHMKCINDESFLMTDVAHEKTAAIKLNSEMHNIQEKISHPINELMQRGEVNSEAEYEKEAIRTELVEIYGPDNFSFIVIFDEKDGKILEYDKYTNVSLLNDGCTAFYRCVDPNHPNEEIPLKQNVRRVNLLEKVRPKVPSGPQNHVTPGLYCLVEGNCCFLFNPDGTGRITFIDPSFNSLSIDGDMNFYYAVDEKCQIEILFDDRFIRGRLMADDEKPGSLYIVLDDSTDVFASSRIEYVHFELVSTNLDELQNLPSTKELLNYVMAYIKATRMIEADEIVYAGWLNGDQVYYVDCRCGGEYASYYIDPISLTGYDVLGNHVCYLKLPVLPENAYSLEEVKIMAIVDFVKRYHVIPRSAYARLNEDGYYEVTMENIHNEDDYRVENYYLDPVTATGENDDGEFIDLPHTGVSSPVQYIVAVLAYLMSAAGFLCCVTVLRKKKTAAEE